MYSNQNTTSTQQTNQYKRTSRHPSDETRQRISQALKGKCKSDSHKQALSASLKDYWAADENFPDDAPEQETGNGWSF